MKEHLTKLKTKEEGEKKMGKTKQIKQKNSNKGITLIALVITIIVLLILAAVSIATLTGENGILTKANEAKEQTEIKSLEEQVKLAIIQAEQKQRNPKMDDVIDELIKNGVITNAEQVNKENGDITSDLGYVLEGMLDDYLTPPPGAPDENGIFTASSTVDGGPASENNPTVPAGFKPVPTETTTWTDEETGKTAPTEGDVKNGLVIEGADGSEFVWVPVPKAVSEDINDKPIAREIEDLKGQKDTNGNKYYQGILYYFESTSSRENPNSDGKAYGQGTTSYREPSLVTGSSKDTKALLGNVVGTKYDAGSKDDKKNVSIAGYDSVQEFGKAMQEEYNRMIESVKTYKGFYVGRYEMSLTGATTDNEGTGTAQSKGNVKSSTTDNENSNMWYGLYSKTKTYTETLKNKLGSEDNVNVVSGMIWGSQFDAMLNWMQGNGVDVNDSYAASYNRTQVTGAKYDKDKINNVYDLIGCNYELTLEAKYDDCRINRGGCYDTNESLSIRLYRGILPTRTYSYYGSRATLYIK